MTKVWVLLNLGPADAAQLADFLNEHDYKPAGKS